MLIGRPHRVNPDIADNDARFVSTRKTKCAPAIQAKPFVLSHIGTPPADDNIQQNAPRTLNDVFIGFEIHAVLHYLRVTRYAQNKRAGIEDDTTERGCSARYGAETNREQHTGYDSSKYSGHGPCYA